MSHVENLESRVHLSAGGVDESFGVDGQVNTLVGGSVDYSGITVLPNGKFIVAGGNPNQKNDADSLMVLYNANGSIDRSFGIGGRVPLSIGGKAVAIDAIGVAPNGGILVAETAADDKTFLVRYTADGTRQTLFGIGGITPMPSGISVEQIKFDSTGNIILASSYYPYLPGGPIPTDGGGSDFALLRFSAAGRRDKSFGTSGLVITQFVGSTWGGYIQPLADGKIMAVMQDSFSDGDVVRFNANGSLDTSYHQTGIGSLAGPPLTSPGTNLVVSILYPVQNAVAQFQPDGSVVVAASYYSDESEPLLVSRITAQGTVDTTFANQGMATLPFTDTPLGIFVQPDGDYLVVANTSRSVVDQNESDNIAIACLTPSGSLDTTFGNQGIVLIDNAPAIGASSAALDGSQVLVEPIGISQSRIAVTAFST